MALNPSDVMVFSPHSPLRRADFLHGFAISEYQNSGSEACPNNNWAQDFETRPGAIQGNNRSGKSCDSWNNIERDIALLKEAGANALRFSLEWSRLEPEEGVYSAEAITHYHAMLDALLGAGITPMVTLLHFTMPMWFVRVGGFEKQENISKFVDFTRRMFEEYKAKVNLWCTINEPGVAGISGYIAGVHWPGLKGRFLAAKQIVTNLLLAHASVYKALKALPGGAEVRIGIVHNALKFESTTSWTPVSALCGYLTTLTHESVMEFLRGSAHAIKIL